MSDNETTKRLKFSAGYCEGVFEAVLRAMQPAEENGGPEPYDYIALMHRIAAEATKRANAAINAQTTHTNLGVIMRPPRKGEHGWWVEARTPVKALAEVIASSENWPCWIAEHDYNALPDENNMIAITVVIGGDS